MTTSAGGWHHRLTTTKYLLCLSVALNLYLLLYIAIFRSVPLSSSPVLPLSPVNLVSHNSSRSITPTANITSLNRTHIIINNKTVDNFNNDNITYGHVHLAKTAGTEINGMLAHSFERVCGHKGYSYDYYQYNEKLAPFKVKKGSVSGLEVRDSFSRLIGGTNRGRVVGHLMDEIGYEDCDYISMEREWKFWKEKLTWTTLELHVPCRRPIEHLMSQCNHRHHSFNCSSDSLEEEIEICMVDPARFSLELQQEPNIHLKCFNPIPVDNYLQYMSQRLQKKKRIRQSPFVHRDTNQKRRKNTECIWKSPDVLQRTREILINNYDLYKFCDQCVGSADELMLT